MGLFGGRGGGVWDVSLADVDELVASPGAGSDSLQTRASGWEARRSEGLRQAAPRPAAFTGVSTGGVLATASRPCCPRAPAASGSDNV